MTLWRRQDDAIEDEIARANTRITFDDPSKTQQHFAKDADLNTIAKRYGITDGAIPPMALNPEYFGDFTDAGDFRDHLDRVKDALDRFNALPANLRSQFNNDPVQLHDWVMDPTNTDEAVTMGLLQKQSVTPPKTPQRDPTTGKEVTPLDSAGVT